MTYSGQPAAVPSIGSMYSSYMDRTQQQYSRPPIQPPPITVPQQVPRQHQSYPQYNLSSTTDVEASPSQGSDVSLDRYRNLPTPAPISKILEGKAYLLEIVQQPLRARMCGFGDKDRRPISPPPCIRLRIIDSETHKDIDYSKIENFSQRFVLMVDLAEPVNLYEQNIVKHSSQSPSISTVTTSAYPPTATNSSPAQSLPSYDVTKASGYSPQSYGPPHPRPSDRQYGVNGTGLPAYYGSGLPFGQAPQGPFAPRYNPQFPNSYTTSTPNHMPPPEPRGSIDSFRSPQSGTCTRNLIGTLAGTATKLKDLNHETGVWFVFQDLSIRTEGDFRLKFSFFDIGNTQFDSNESSTTSLALLAPMLACSYSDPFHVYSAKKFPGVIESTALSKEFSHQGVKIPIRKGDGKDGQKSGGKRKRSGDDGSEDSAHGPLEEDYS